MGLDELRARLDRILAGQESAPDRRARASGLHGAMVEFKTALAENRGALTVAEQELAGERRQLEDALRRGRLAAEIADAETVRIAGEFAERHRERGAILERKVAVIREEIAYMEREYQSLKGQYQAARQSSGLSEAVPPVDLPDREFDALKARSDREAAEQAAKAQLELLKKKLGKQ
jgi:hypothetical protein